MTDAGAAASLAEMLDERRHLLEIAEWMFGAATADQVVHETYRRWYALDDDERAGIAVPRAWLTRVAGGICLNLLAAADNGGPAIRRDPVRRPEPHPTPGSVTAWLQRHPQQDHSDPALLARHDHIVRRFAAACDSEDTAVLKTVLAADAIVVSDCGGKVRAAVHPFHGADAIAHFITALLAGRPRTAVTIESVNGHTGLALRRAGQAGAVVSVSTADTEVTALWITLNPDKLRCWHRP
jgi:RNA polymerase sigma-70 factor (ECF subfamily)